MNPHDIEFIYELSPMQQAMLFHTVYSPGSGVYVLQTSLRLTGRLDVAAFERAWRHVAARHGILRSAFFWEELEKPVQVVYRKIDLEVARLSWSDLSAAPADQERVQRERLERFLVADRERGFDLGAAPLMRVALIELGADVHQLVWTLHHLVVDGWSQGLLLRELFTSYAELAAGREPALAPAGSFRDYIGWLHRQDMAAAEAFWRQSLAGLTAPTLIVPGAAADGEADAPTHHEARRWEVRLPPEVTEALSETARRKRLTLNTLVQGAWALVLAQRAGGEDAVFGATVAGRPADLPGVGSIVGPFINTLPVRITVRPERRLWQWLAEVQDLQADLRRYEHSPLVDVQRWSGLPARMPLFDHIVVFENLALAGDAGDAADSGTALVLPGLDIAEEAASTLTNYPLNVIVLPGRELTLSLLYDAERLAAPEVARLAERLAGVLRAFAVSDEGTDPRLADLPLLLPGERQQALVEWNDTRSDFPREASLPELFAAVAATTPDAPAVIGAEGAVWSYRRLDAASSRLARRLRALGVGLETAVGIAMERSPELIVGTLAILKAGGVYVPLDVSYPDERIAFMLADTGAEIVLAEGQARERLAGRARLVEVEEETDKDVKDLKDSKDEKSWIPAASLAYVIYTSGSTGRPKGVGVTHRAIVRLVRETNYVRLGPGERTGQVANISFDAATYEIWGALLTGAAMVVVPREVVLSPAAFAAAIRERGITSMFLTSALFTRMAREEPDAFAAMSELLVGGEAVDPGAARTVLAGRPPRRLLNGYGPTESTTFATWHPIREAPDGSGIPIGRALANTSLHVLDRRHAPVPPGTAGELCIGGDGLARGYLNRPELTAERFIPDFLGNGERLYRTGDLVRQRPDGVIEFLSRLDQQVKIRGFRIEPGEIEAVLSGHPEVRECAVVANVVSGGDARLVAYVVGGEAPLRAWLQERLPDYMVPSAFVYLDALPLTANGKLDRKALRAPEQAAGGEAVEGFAAPADPTTELLADIWAEVLGLARVGIHDDFFALGGHSLLATQVASRIRSVLGVELPLRLLFEAPTLAGLAHAVREHRGGHPAPPLVPVPRGLPGQELLLSFAQQRLWLIDQLVPGSPAYNMPAAVRLSGELAVDRLAAVFAAVIRRHEALRTRFAAKEGRPVQVIASLDAAFRPDLPVVDLAGLPEATREAAALVLAREEARRPFDLGQGPLLRLTLVRLAAGEHLLLMTLHHIVSDGWSMGVLLREIGALSGPAGGSILPELPIQYADFAVWQRSWLQGEALAEQVDWWREELAGVPATLDLPLDRLRSPFQSDRAGAVPVVLPRELMEPVRELARREGATPFMILLAVFQTLLRRMGAQEDVTVGTPVANRNRIETENLIGFFVNTLVLRGRFGGDLTVLDLLVQTREASLGAFGHQDVPFEKLVEELVPQRNPLVSPLFQVFFSVQTAPPERLVVPGLILEPVALQASHALFDLSLDLADRDGVLSGGLEFRSDLFDHTTAARLRAGLEHLLRGLLAVPESRVAELPLLGEGERHQIQREWNENAALAVESASLVPLFEGWADRAPDAPALAEGAAGGRRFTYRELDRWANRLAHRLRRLGVGWETRVAVLVERSPELIAAMLGILKAGGVYVPLDPAYPRERLAVMLEDSEAPVLITQERLVGRLSVLQSAAPRIVSLDAPGLDLESESPERLPDGAPEPDQLAYVIFTSGSTGRPKGVMGSHGALARYAVAVRPVYRVQPGERILQFCSISFDTSLEEISIALGGGGELVLRTDAMLESPAGFLAACGEQAINVLSLPTAYWHEVAAKLEVERLALPAALRLVIIGGERALPERVAAWRRHVAAGGPRLLNSYGLTESTIVSTAWPVDQPSAAEARGEVSIGRAIPETELYLLGEDEEILPIGVPGELFIGGTLLARGYLKRPDLTAERFVPHPFSDAPGERLYRTGDLARALPDGALELLGRGDAQVKVRGYRIELTEIESRLLQHPGIESAVVTVREDQPGVKQIVGHVVPRQEPGPDPAGLRAFVREALPDYMVPGAFVVLAALPLTPNGKVDRRALPAPERQDEETVEHERPADPVEALLVDIWAEVLGVGRVGVREDFFTLGGHSLLATQVVSRVRAALDVELPLRKLFEAPTVAELAEAVRAVRGDATAQAPPLAVIAASADTADDADRAEPPLSFAQQRLWLIDQLEPDSPVYNIPSAVRLAGDLSVPLLERIFAEVVRRHEALRTTFSAQAGQPVQVIHPPEAPVIPLADLSSLPAAVRDGEAAALVRMEAAQPFDLRRGPLLRLRLMRLDARDHVLLMTMHHIISDGWSMGVLLREVGSLYAAFAAGRPSPLPELPLQYADFAVWQRGWLQGATLEAQLAFWREELAGAPVVLDLPTDRPRPAVQTSRGAARPLTLPPGVSAAVSALGRRAGATPFMVLLAAWGLTLGRHAAFPAMDDLLIGSPIAGRNRREIEDLIGFFVNTLVLRIDSRGGRGAPSFAELLARVRRAALGAFGHQDLPFERLVEELVPARDLSRSPLFQALFVLQNAPERSVNLPGLTLSPVTLENEVAKFDLTLALAETGEGFIGALEHNTDLFDSTTAMRLLARFAVLLEAAASDPERGIGDLPLLQPAERHQALAEWNDAVTAFPREESLAELFAAVALAQPDAAAVITDDETWSYQRLDEASDRLAGRLAALGAGLETAVGICMERSAELIVGVLAIVKAGGVYVPLDPGYPDERLDFMLADTGAEVVLVHERTRERMAGRGGVVALEAKDKDSKDLKDLKDEKKRIPAASLAYVIYTSGSTGRPKGVAVPQRAVARLVLATNYVKLGPGDRTGHVANISFDAATYEIWGALLTGAAVVVIPREVVLSPADFSRRLCEQAVTSMFLTSALFTRMAREAPDAFASMRELLVGGEAVDPAAARAVLSGRPPQRLLNGYGPTESTTFAAWHPIRAVAAGATTVPIGRPLANTTLYVVDRAHTPVPPGAVGELCIGGDGLARGYLNRPELTAERFVPDPLGDGERLYRSGDLVRQRPDGAIEYLGRLDNQVKIRGFRIEPGEIEAVLAGHPDVRECAVVVNTDKPGEIRLIAYAAAREDRPVRTAELRSWLQERLPDYMLPAAIVLLDALPLTSNGKLDRRALLAPERIGEVRAEEGWVAPADPLEEMLAAFWGELLRVPPESIGRHDDFFALGGHSLLATQVTSRIRDILGVELPLRRLFNAATVAGLAAAVREARAAAREHRPAPPIVPVPRAAFVDGLPLSFAQQRLWLIDQLEPGNPAYNIPLAVRLTGAVAPGLLAGIFAEVVRRHEALRTTFDLRDSRPAQVISPAGSPALPVIDLTGLPAPGREAVARAVARGEARRPFDLRRGPLLRLCLVRLDEKDHLLLMTMHHIVSDGWSMGVLLREVAALFAGSPLPDLPVQYADFAVWQRGWLQGDVLEQQIAYWRRELAGAPRLLDLPTDRPRPAVQTFRGGLRPAALPSALSAAVRELCRREGVTPFMALLAAWAVLLGRHANQDDVVLGSPIAGRNRQETEGLIGFFVNTLVLRVDLRDGGFADLLGRVRRTALDAFAHQDLPFERLVEELVPERDLAVPPLFQALFALQNAAAGGIGDLAVPGLALSVVPVESGTAMFDLTLTLGEGGDGFAGGLEHNADLFDGSTAERLLERFEVLLAAVAADPRQPVADLALLPPAEREQIVSWSGAWSEAAGEALPVPSFPELFAAQAAQTPDAPALVFAGEPVAEISYRELDRWSASWADRLRRLGVGPDVPVGICLRRSPRMIMAMLAVLRAGGAYVPLDPAYPSDRLAWMLDDARVGLVLTETGTVERLGGWPAGEGRKARRRLLLVSSLERHPEGEERAGRIWEGGTLPAPAQAAYVIYTSGSTGRPKGSVGTHGGLAAFTAALADVMDLTPADRVLQFASISFDASAVAIYTTLSRGAAIVLHPEPATLSTTGLLQLCAAHGVTVLELPAALWRLTAQQVEASGLRFGEAARLFMTGGESLSPEALRQWGRTVAPAARLVSSYGPTEATVVATVYTAEGGAAREADLTGAALGRPLAGTAVHLLDARLHPAPLGVAGEIFLGGAGVTRGYLRRPDLTAAVFVPDPWGAPGARLYRTGDRARRRTDGELEFLGRVDQQVKLRGFRIEPGEIETVLAGHPAAGECVVIVRKDVLVAYVVPAVPNDVQEGGVQPAALRSWLQERLPEHMIPSAFVILDALPLTANGKVDRKALPAPETAAAAAETGYTASTDPTDPTDPITELLAGIWSEVLGVPRVGMHDDFFALGGHSLLATQVVSSIRNVLGVELPLRRLFEAPTIAGLAQVVRALLQGDEEGAVAPMTAVRVAGEELHLSFAQQRLWLLDQLAPGNPAYNLPSAVRLSGEVPAGRFERIFAETVRRHEPLRTTFGASEGRPVQVIADPAPVVLPVIDLAGLPEAAREAEALALAGAESARPFDLQRGPLLRLGLVRLAGGKGDGDHLLLMTMHHIVSDGWSMGVLLREVAALWTAFAEGRPSPLPELGVQYADFARWQRARMGEVLEEQLAYWRRELADAPAVLELPADRPRPAVQSWRGSTLPVNLSPALSDRVRDLCRQLGVTPFMALLAAWATLLGRHSGGQDDVLVGSPIAGRNRQEIEGLIGFFVNTLVLRVALKAERSERLEPAEAPGFGELLRRVRRTALDAFTHQDLPFERIVEEVAPERALSHTPLFQVLFALQSAIGRGFDLPGLTIAPVEVDSHVVKFDLALTLADGEGSFAGALELNTDLFDAATAERLLARFEVLLHAAVAAPEQPVLDLPLLAPGERQELLAWGQAAAPAPAVPSIPELFAAQVKRNPDAPALIFLDGLAETAETVSYRDLDRQSALWARRLRELGVGPDVPVGICLRRSPRMIAALLAVLRAGGVYVPLDPAYPAERLAWMLDDARIDLMLTETGTAERLAESSRPVQRLFLDHNPKVGEGLAPSRVGGGQAAYIIYTSGSTGKPKGSVATHGGLAAFTVALANVMELTPEDRVLQFASISFDASAVAIYTALSRGAAIVLHPEPASLSTAELLRLCAAQRVTVLELPAALWRLTAQEVAASGQTFGREARLFMTGGESLSPAALRQWGRTVAPAARLISSYGPTEATVVATVHGTDGRAARDAALALAAGTELGRPLAGTTVHLLDSRLAPVPPGVAGEIFLGGSGVTRGYLRRPDLTAAVFLPDPWGAPGARLYRTGDRARWRRDGLDGSLEFLGRVDNQVKLRGFRIEPGEIEAVLADHPAVGECAVAVVQDSLVAWAARREPHAPAAVELRSWLEERLPAHMVPAAFVLLDTLPLTANGKVDRKALPVPERKGAAGERPESEAWAAPSDPVEGLLAEIWSAVLGVERIGLHDDFFTLGGHSLLATQVVSRIRGVLGVELPLRRMFEAPTIAGLGRAVRAALDQQSGPPAPPIVPIVPVDFLADRALPLSFAQQRLWFLDRLEPGNAAYNIPSAVRLGGEWPLDLLERIFAEVVRRHAVLRTTFALRDGNPAQIVAPYDQPAIPLIDLTHLPAAEREERARSLAAAEARRPFDLERRPLLRLALVRLEDRDHVLLMTMHHIVSDGWSMGVLQRELGILHRAFSQGRPSPLPELPVQYADFAVWQRDWLRGEVLEAQLAFWRGQLAGAPQVLDLPLDRPRPAEQTFRGATLPLTLPAELSAALRGLCQRQGVTPFMALLAAWGLLLGRHTSQAGQDDVLLGTPIAGRNRQETEGLIGFFVNTLVMRVDMRPEAAEPPSFAALLGRVRRESLDAYTHQDLPFEHLVEALVAERDLAVSPLFQVLFVFQNAAGPAAAGNGEAGLAMEPLEVESGLAKFDLTLTVGDGADGTFAGALEYNTDLFDAGTAERLWSRFQTLLQASVDAPDAPVVDLPLLAPAERRQLIAWNETGPAVAPDSGLHELFFAQAEKTPEAVALVHGRPEASDESSSQTYAELASRAADLARTLVSLGVRPEARVGVCLERSPDLIASLLGVLAAGGAYVPIDPAYPLERRRLMLEDSGATVLLSRGKLATGLMEGTGARLFDLDRDKIPATTSGNLPARTGAAPGHLAYVIYTSGSTGRPKGVAIEHRSAVALAHWARGTFSSAELSGMLAATSVCFDLSVFEIFAPLAWGGRLILAENALELAALPAAGEVRVLNTVPSAATELLRLGLPASVCTVCLAGEPLPGALVERLYATGTVERVLNLYGPSEDTTYSTEALVPRGDRAPAIGRPLPGTRAWVVDRRGGLVPPGVAGELWLAGAGLARGYLGRPELTAERFTPDPFGVSGVGGERVYRTGDLVRHRVDDPNGELDFLDRIDHQVKVRGFRIELGEIEAVLRGHPSVRDCVVVARRDVLVAYLAGPASDGEGDEIRAWLAGKLPAHMVPSLFVLMEELPRTVNGKVDRRALPEPGAVRGPERVYLAPRDALELRLASLWEELLGVVPVGVRDDFFALGGHSLLAVQLVSRLQTMLGIDLPLATLLRNPTVERLATMLRAGAGPAREALVPLTGEIGSADHSNHSETRPLFLVHAIGGEVLSYIHLARALAADRPVYGIQVPDGGGEAATLEEMAAGYLRAVRAVQPEGPYTLGGWSLGGVVALEMARQLERHGESVDLVVLIDSRAPGAEEGHPLRTGGELVAQFAYDLGRIFGLGGFALPPNFADLTAAEALDRLAAEAARSGALPPGLDAGELARRFAVFAANFRAFESYRGGPCGVPLILFRAGGSQDSEIPADLGWERLLGRPVESRLMPGDHYTLLQPPHVEELAVQLRQALLEIAQECLSETT